MKSLFHKRTFVFICVSLALGIVFTELTNVHFDSLVGLLLLPALIGLTLLFRRINSLLFFISSQTFFFLLGAFLYQNVAPNYQNGWLENFDTENFKGKLIITEVANTDKEWVKCRAEVQRVYVGNSSLERHFQLLIFVKSHPDFLKKGDEIITKVPLTKIKNKGNPGEFDAYVGNLMNPTLSLL